MHANVGPTEQKVRLAIGAAAAAAALKAHGWQRTALCTIATAGFMTGMTRYCPINEAMGRTVEESSLIPGENQFTREATRTAPWEPSPIIEPAPFRSDSGMFQST